MQGDLFGSTHKEYVKIVRKGKSNTRVELPDGSQALVPTADLAFWKYTGPTEEQKVKSESAKTSTSRRSSRPYQGAPDHPFDRLDFSGEHDAVKFDLMTDSPF